MQRERERSRAMVEGPSDGGKDVGLYDVPRYQV
jgi:hypothetical protein